VRGFVVDLCLEILDELGHRLLLGVAAAEDVPHCNVLDPVLATITPPSPVNARRGVEKLKVRLHGAADIYAALTGFKMVRTHRIRLGGNGGKNSIRPAKVIMNSEARFNQHFRRCFVIHAHEPPVLYKNVNGKVFLKKYLTLVYELINSSPSRTNPI
jgi:hypothetical protein